MDNLICLYIAKEEKMRSRKQSLREADMSESILLMRKFSEEDEEE